jgi:hypothetical protein
MRSPFGNSGSVTNEIQGQFTEGRDKLVTRNFGPIAKVLWPVKTAAHVAAIAGRDERTAKRWLSGEFDPPLIVVVATMEAIFVKRD